MIHSNGKVSTEADVLTHFVPTRDYNKATVEGGTETEHFTTYNGYINPSQMKGAWARYSQKYLNEVSTLQLRLRRWWRHSTKDMLENQDVWQRSPGYAENKDVCKRILPCSG